MRRIAALIILLSAIVSTPAAGQVADKIDWPAFMAKQDLLWTKMPTKWTEGAFLGNGQLGAMIFAGDGNSLRWHIGRSDVVYAGNRIPVGDLLLKPVGKITGLSMRLDLWNAEATGTLTTDAGQIQFRSFTHADQMVQVIQITPSDGESKCTFEWAPGLAVNPRDVHEKIETPENERNPLPVKSDSGDMHLCFQPLRTGGGHTTAMKEISGPDHSRVLLVAVGFSRKENPQSEAMDDIAKAESTGLDTLVSTHRDWWHHYLPESFVSFPDARLQSFYWIQMYKLGSATRADRPAIDLMGPWFNDTPWPKIWWNLNIQLTYWPVLTSNRLELGESLCRMLDNGAAALAKNAGKYSEDSSAIGRSCSYDLVRPVGEELCDLPWAMHNYYLQYRYSMDESMLRDRIFPLLERSINYYLHLLAKGPDGKLHITRGYSPEYPGQPTPNPDTNIDLALLRWGCQTLLDTCAQLNIDDPKIPVWKDTLANLTPYPVDENGLRISAGMPFAVSHRHFSHLLMVYPLYIMNWDQPENRDLISKTLDHWQSMPKALRGYSYTGAASISAMMGKGDDAGMYLNRLLDKVIHPNTMYTEAGPVIETPLSGAASVHDMLLTSWGDKIRVFPGVPKSWAEVSFVNLRTQGAFLVTAVRKNGRTSFVKIESLAGEPCRVWSDMSDPVADGGVGIKSVGEGVVQLDLKKGEMALLYPGDDKPDLSVAPVEANGPTNFYGVH